MNPKTVKKTGLVFYSEYFTLNSSEILRFPEEKERISIKLQYTRAI